MSKSNGAVGRPGMAGSSASRVETKLAFGEAYRIDSARVSVTFRGSTITLGRDEFWPFMELMSKAAVSLAEKEVSQRPAGE
jgi:hypothetical protein